MPASHNQAAAPSGPWILPGAKPPAVTDETARIFVQIASFRDPECQWTVRDLFEKAKHPERILVGICWQFMPEEDRHCFETVTRPEQMRTLKFHAKESRGVCWARHLIQKLWRGEEYTLQIDSHMRFAPHWDDRMISMLQRCDSETPLLTTYPPGYTPPSTLDAPSFPRLTAREFSKNGVLEFLATFGPGEKPPVKPVPGAFVSGNFLFGPSKIITEVPYDPFLYFYGEEISMSARLWTHGWDLFAPNEVVIYHQYIRKGEPRHWGHHTEWWMRDKLAHARVRHLLGTELSSDPEVTVELEKYGLGSKRSVAEYERFCGVNFKAKTISDNAKKGIFPATTATVMSVATLARTLKQSSNKPAPPAPTVRPAQGQPAQTPRAIGPEPVRMTKVGKMWVIEGDRLFAAWFEKTGDKFSPEIVETACSFVTNFAVAVDVGAHYGSVTRQIAPRFGRVYAYEPAFDTFACLQRNIETYPNIACFNLALGDHEGRVSVGYSAETAKYLGTAQEAQRANTGCRQILGDGDIAMTTLDSLSLTDVGLIKIDVEGYEYSVLRGARKLIAACGPVILIEDKGLGRLFGLKGNECRVLLDALGYRVAATSPYGDFVYIRN